MLRLAALRDLAIVIIAILALGWTIYLLLAHVACLENSLGFIKDWATVIGVIIALVTYVTNSMAQRRQRIIENVSRFNEAHLSLYKEGKFLHEKYEFMDEDVNGLPTLKLNRDDPNELTMFHEFLGEIEHFAILQTIGAISKNGNAYFFGWYAKQIKPLIDEERPEPFWQVAVKFIDEMAAEGERFTRMSPDEQATYLSTQIFNH